MRNKKLHRLCTLLLALVLVIMPLSGFRTPAVHAADDFLNTSLPMPWGVQWEGLRTITWEPPAIGSTGKETYAVELTIADDAYGKNAKYKIGFLPVNGFRYTFDTKYFEDRTKYYRASVRILDGSDARYHGEAAYTQFIYGKTLLGGFTPMKNVETSEQIGVNVDKKITSANRIHLNIDPSQYAGSNMLSFQQVIQYGSLPPGMDWGYGEAEAPYLVGTPTKMGEYKVAFAVHLTNGQNILDTVTIVVLPKSMEYIERSVRYIDKGIAITAFKPVFTGSNVSVGAIKDGALPPGLGIDYNKGVITGTPTKIGKYGVTISGWDKYQNEYTFYTLFMVLEHKGSYVTQWQLEKGKAYDFYLTPHVNGHYQMANLTSGSLPPGMSWQYSETKGVQITGTPTEAGNFEPMFKIISVTGEWNYETMKISVTAPVEKTDLYEVDLTGETPSMTKAEYEKVLKGTLEAAVKGKQIKAQSKKVLGITFTQYDFDGDGKNDFSLAPKGNDVLLSQISGNEKTEDFFLDLNEASINAAENGTLNYAETVAFRVPGPEIKNPFTDFDAELYCYEPILWAYYHNPQITNGLSNTEFGPNAKCSRAQIVTFLWRAAGCPEPSKKTTTFTDVNTGSWYGKAVLWAVEKGITSGVSKTSFDPNGDCTRAQVVTFLFRYGGRIVGDSTAASQFKDINTGLYYGDAVEWAVKFNITKGTSNTTFGPNDSCTRGQIVTFLYRMLYSYNELKPNDFLMYVDDFVSVGDGVYLFQGTITNGSVRFGSRINIQSYDPKYGNAFGRDAVVSRVQVRKSGRFVDSMQATKGQSVAIYVNSLYLPDLVRKGDALIGIFADIRQVKTNVQGNVTMESAADPNNVLREGMKPTVYLGGDIIATVSEIYGGELKAGKTGENVLWIDFDRSAVFYVGQELFIRKGGRTCGKVTITKVGP